MATFVQGGPRMWGGSRDPEGYRTYKVVHLVGATAADGPANVMQTAGLPSVGSFWAFGDDLDIYAWCRPDMTVRSLGAHQPMTPANEALRWFEVEQTFSNKPLPRNQQRCSDTQIEDPLLEPAKVSGGTTKYQEEVCYNYDGTPIRTSSWELLRGPQVEFDKSRPNIRIEQNVPTFYLAATLPNSLIDSVNDATLWGYGARKVKLSSYSWEQQYHGSCYLYYRRTLEFEVRGDTLGFDRVLLDEGTKALNGEWNHSTGNWELKGVGIFEVTPDRNNPADFCRFRDRSGELSRVILNGRGVPVNLENTGTADDSAGSVSAYVYPPANFLALGIPTIF